VSLGKQRIEHADLVAGGHERFDEPRPMNPAPPVTRSGSSRADLADEAGEVLSMFTFENRVEHVVQDPDRVRVAHQLSPVRARAPRHL